ncbi:hypothetical protein BSY240_605 [Agrobacterium sp. RAC06]|nr:hypothetical protein BSY240_605 [Agrobacterium sp. RAC06]
MKYPICNALSANAAKHCAALVVTENFEVGTRTLSKLAQPKETLRNGTLTFVSSKGRTFGITCKHVVQHYRDLTAASDKSAYSMRTMLNGFYVVMDRFKTPQPQYGDGPLDIAVREVMPEFIAKLGKEPFDLDACPDLPSQIRHGYAVGFPETLKRRVQSDPLGYKVSMPQLEVLAELRHTPTRRFQLVSEIGEPPKHSDFSGMSGGPIFWSTETEYGMLGITYEGDVGSDGRSIHIFGEFAARDTILDWIDQL